MKQHKSRKAFTLVELVIVIAVIAVLAVVLVPTFSNMIAKAQDSKAMQEAKNAYTNYVADSDGDTPEFMVYRLGERFVALHNGAPIGLFADKESALGAMMDEYDISKLVDTGDGKLWVYEVGGVGNEENTEPVEVVGDSLSFIPHPAVKDFVENSSVPVIKLYSVFTPEDYFDERSIRERIEREDLQVSYLTYDSNKRFEEYGSGGVECKCIENDEAYDRGYGYERSVVIYQYTNSAKALFAATPVTRDIISIEIQETYCLVDINPDTMLIYFVTNHGDYIYYEYYFGYGYGKYLIPSELFYEWIQEGRVITSAPEQYHVGLVEIEEWLASEIDSIMGYCTVKK